MQGLQQEQEQEQDKNKLASLQWFCASFCSFFSLYVMNECISKRKCKWSLNQYRDKSRCGALSTSSSAKSHQINIIALLALPTDQEHWPFSDQPFLGIVD